MREIMDAFKDLPHLRQAVAAFKLIGDDAVLNSGNVALFESQLRNDYRMNDHFSTCKEFIQHVCKIRFDRDCASREWKNVVAAIPQAYAEMLKQCHPLNKTKVKVDDKYSVVKKKRVGKQSMAESEILARALEFTLVDEGFSIVTEGGCDVYVGFLAMPSLSESVELECADNPASIALAGQICKFMDMESIGVAPQVQGKDVVIFNVMPSVECGDEAYVAITVPISSNKQTQSDKRDAVIRAVKNAILSSFE